ncbi:type II toxin-antitoxin system RelE/ParE family toxin [Desertifilum sp. FACHB-1129]|uniref:Plasmid stabilization protein n=1 Tax=Desertifilum tharense IPPAS B-1220 TaxID=1781255 RepID=A0A1E5QMX2_9CYAN|nr:MULTISPECIES: type II toxin-antitoxin system RelE/ParE family toxin [Desertifilum]MDA0208837.1 type II toxin-antitoxin system RelE/ParE family toxin [Cyanobacteria bacterium FC1]MBD2311038.1 type II toxin-antitoxin system RelE/ParE family toxin [Desertifilum sp. FACHB-1129]MBD2321443.1 type II toxin-antitoxin system RelE/ParE family toxin [Desertifilum sp. FACHB-866]MBD2331250.1 type II toxin-antitoxin system RelE/ParE family toxin [Desertifilum sp. FACHB-868]OEJ75978.1 plasmid stabilizatio
MAIVVKRPRAELDLLDIWDYIADDSMDRADEFLNRIEEKLRLIARSPGVGRKRDELLPGLQSFPIGNYVVFYQEIPDGIDVIRVLRGSRDIEAIFGQG